MARDEFFDDLRETSLERSFRDREFRDKAYFTGLAGYPYSEEDLIIKIICVN